jgi:hypothetical protein
MIPSAHSSLRTLLALGVLMGEGFPCCALDEKENVTLFFKRAISSPPEIENFVGSQKRLREMNYQRATR